MNENNCPKCGKKLEMVLFWDFEKQQEFPMPYCLCQGPRLGMKVPTCDRHPGCQKVWNETEGWLCYYCEKENKYISLPSHEDLVAIMLNSCKDGGLFPYWIQQHVRELDTNGSMLRTFVDVFAKVILDELEKKEIK